MKEKKLVKTKELQIVCLNDRPELLEGMAQWFHEKWGLPLETYRESMTDSIRLRMILPKWYVVLAEDKIVGGAGVVENDFQERTDLAPNVCALYVEKEYRGRGLAKKLLEHVCTQMKKARISTLYLVTEHSGFYEKLGWEFLCMVKETGSDNEVRMYVHHQ